MQISSFRFISVMCGLFVFVIAFSFECWSQVLPASTLVKTGAERMDQYLPDLKGKNIALVVNQTSIVANTHLADTLISSKIAVKKIFAPEHGFRGDADAGQTISSGAD